MTRQLTSGLMYALASHSGMNVSPAWTSDHVVSVLQPPCQKRSVPVQRLSTSTYQNHEQRHRLRGTT